MNPLFDVTGKVVVITGAAGGIGRALVKGFADAGATVIAADLAQDAVTALAGEWDDGDDGDVRGVALDVADPAQLSRVVDDTVARHGRIDVLINNAGVKSDQSILTGARDRWDRTLDINAGSVLALSRLVVEKSMRQHGGAIINTGSSVSSRAAVLNYQAGGADYCLSKAMVHSLTQLLAYETAPLGITVNAIAPGIVDTPMHGRPTEETEARHAGKIPLRRVGKPTDFVGPALFLASPGAGYVTGQILHVNGGMVMEP
ncbi:SDR family NAD(P)-dependent oxidoreductase [Streptomyces sp. NPDC056716]|uniref:SDR family NAD(P)-dependent oxidoreductase n=1 Tax=unclassified Streptomyces TaxID=2593676 RepID=UPI0036C13545